MLLQGVILEQDHISHFEVGLFPAPLASGLKRLNVSDMPPLPQAFNFVAEQIPANSLNLLWNVIWMSSNGPSNQEVAWSYDFNSIIRIHAD